MDERTFKRIKPNKETTETENMDSTTTNEVDEANDTTLSMELDKPYNRPYSEEDDKKIIKYFNANLKLLDMKNDLSIYTVLNAKYSFQRTVQSLRKRFLKKILPNLDKYKILSNSEIIDFYDAAKLEMPEEMINKLGQPDEASKQQEMINNLSQSDEASNQEENNITMKSILDFIQLKNSQGMAVYIPDTVTNLRSIEKKLFDEFGIKKEFIKVVPNSAYNILKQLKQAHEDYDALMNHFFCNRIHNQELVKAMMPDARQLFEGMPDGTSLNNCLATDITENANENETAPPVDDEENISIINISDEPDEQNANDANDEQNKTFNETYSGIEIDNVGQIICNLSSVSISQDATVGVDQDQTREIIPDQSRENLAEIITNDKDPDESREKLVENNSTDSMFLSTCSDLEFSNFPNIETQDLTRNCQDHDAPECRKRRLSDHTYCKNNQFDDTDSQNVIDFACTSQVKFSKRCQLKIVKDNINVDNLLIRNVADINEILSQNKDDVESFLNSSKIQNEDEFDSTNSSSNQI